MCDTATVLSEYRKTPGYNAGALADAMGIKVSTLDRILNPNDHPDLGVCKLVNFIQATGNYSLVDHIEARLGRVAFKLDLQGSLHLDADGLSHFMREAGHALSALSEAFCDGRITRDEAIQCRREILHLIAVGSQFVARLEEITR